MTALMICGIIANILRVGAFDEKRTELPSVALEKEENRVLLPAVYGALPNHLPCISVFLSLL
jgi:hypothetical protein